MRRIAVMDLETTGVLPHLFNRVIEIGVVVLDERGQVELEYETLVNPDRDIGDSGIHSITSADVKHAPRFDQVAGDLIEVLKPCKVLAGHNVRFDHRFLQYEYERLATKLPSVPLMCTKAHFGGSLACILERLGIPFEGIPHKAICDARMTAAIVQRMIENGALEEHEDLVDLEWPQLQSLKTACYCREAAEARKSAPPRFLQRILDLVHHDVESSTSKVLAYLALLDRVLEDRTIDEREEDVLVESAITLGLSRSQVLLMHERYLQNLVVAALSDGVVSECERQDLHAVTRLLGRSNELAGKSVCFTGELLATIRGERISRAMAEKLASKAGMTVANSVTKGLDILVVADPDTMSGKAKKARAYETRILADAVFWPMIDVKVD